MRTNSLNGEGVEEKYLNRGRGRETQNSFVQSMMAGWTRKQMKFESWEWDHNCNTGNVTADGKYLEEVDSFDIDGIQGRNIAEYSEQR